MNEYAIKEEGYSTKVIKGATIQSALGKYFRLYGHQLRKNDHTKISIYRRY